MASDRLSKPAAILLPLVGGMLGGCYLFPAPGFTVNRISTFEHEIAMDFDAKPRSTPERTVTRMARGLCPTRYRISAPTVRTPKEGQIEKVWRVSCQ